MNTIVKQKEGWTEIPFPHIHINKHFYNSPIWIDKEKKKYYCTCELSNTHLTNIIHLLENINIPFPMFGSDTDAQFFAEREYMTENEQLISNIEFFRRLAKERNLI